MALVYMIKNKSLGNRKSVKNNNIFCLASRHYQVGLTNSKSKSNKSSELS